MQFAIRFIKLRHVRLDTCKNETSSSDSACPNSPRSSSHLRQTPMDRLKQQIHAPTSLKRVSSRPSPIHHHNILFSSWKVIYRGEKSYNKISKLTEGTSYRFRVSASNSSGDGPFSSIFEVTTPRCPPPNIRRAPVVATSVENRSATISWTMESNLVDLKYRVELLRGEETLRSLTTTKQELKIENLDTNINYAVRVQSQRDGQWAECSPEKSFCLVFKEVKEVKETKKSTPSMKKIFEEDSITGKLKNIKTN